MFLEYCDRACHAKTCFQDLTEFGAEFLAAAATEGPQCSEQAERHIL